MKALNLPKAVAAYFDADRQDGYAVASCFTRRGVVTDEGRSHVGFTAIESWKNAASAQYAYVASPLAIDKQDDRFIVKGRVAGDFPGSPADLQFIFTLERGKIASLEITP